MGTFGLNEQKASLFISSAFAQAQCLDKQSQAVTDRTLWWLRVPLAHRTGTLRGSVPTAEQHTHSCSTAALCREYMDLLRHLPWKTDRWRDSEESRGGVGEQVGRVALWVNGCSLKFRVKFCLKISLCLCCFLPHSSAAQSVDLIGSRPLWRSQAFPQSSGTQVRYLHIHTHISIKNPASTFFLFYFICIYFYYCMTYLVTYTSHSMFFQSGWLSPVNKQHTGIIINLLKT